MTVASTVTVSAAAGEEGTILRVAPRQTPNPTSAQLDETRNNGTMTTSEAVPIGASRSKAVHPGGHPWVWRTRTSDQDYSMHQPVWSFPTDDVGPSERPD